MSRALKAIVPVASVMGLLWWAVGTAAAPQQTAAAVAERNHLFPIDPKAYLQGQFRPDTTVDFVLLPLDLTDGSDQYLRSEVAAALARMAREAHAAGVLLKAVSTTRSYARQRTIWNGKFTGQRLANGMNLAEQYPDTLQRCLAILEYSSAPGTSRHHWGTDVDLNCVSMSYWETEEGRTVLHWLRENAPEYGFYLAYTEGREHGYQYEPWHWSYRPMAQPLLRHYNRIIGAEDLAGFHGSGKIRTLPWKEWYVNGVNEALR